MIQLLPLSQFCRFVSFLRFRAELCSRTLRHDLASDNSIPELLLNLIPLYLIHYCTSVNNAFWYQCTRTASVTSVHSTPLSSVHNTFWYQQCTRTASDTTFLFHFDTRTVSNKYLRLLAFTCSALKCCSTMEWLFGLYISQSAEQAATAAVRMVETIDTLHCLGVWSYFSGGKYI